MTRLPLLEDLHKLDAGPRKFLLFTAFNVVAWQCVAGSMLVLFARRLEMPPAWVGFLLSFMPLSTLLVAFTVPLVTRLGSKRLMWTTWLLRNIIASGVFIMPVAIRIWGPRAAWYVLLSATLGFCLMRAVGAGAWLPWLHEMVTETQRGYYFSAEAAVTQSVNVAISLGLAVALYGDPGVTRYLVLYALGIGAGLISLIWMSRVPGGKSEHPHQPFSLGGATYKRALQDKPFRRFLIVAACSLSATSWFGSALVLYLRDALQWSSNAVMFALALGSAGVFWTIRYWCRYTEHTGSASAMSKTLFGHSAAAAAFLCMLPGAVWTPYLSPAVVASAVVFGAAFWMSANRAMLGFVPSSHRVGYTNAWTIATAISLGGTPILAGWTIDAFGIWGFRLCFALAGVGGAICALACAWAVEEGGIPARPRLSAMFNPGLPVRTLARVMWITLGLDETNRPERSGESPVTGSQQ